MQLLDISLAPGEKQLRQFGWVSAAAFPLLGLFIYWRGGLFAVDFGAGTVVAAVALAGLGLVSGVLALLAPSALRPLYVTLIVVTYPIGLLLSYGLMALLFFGVFTPLGLLFRLIGRDPLHRRFEPEAESYWVRPRRRASNESYFKQF